MSLLAELASCPDLEEELIALLAPALAQREAWEDARRRTGLDLRMQILNRAKSGSPSAPLYGNCPNEDYSLELKFDSGRVYVTAYENRRYERWEVLPEDRALAQLLALGVDPSQLGDECQSALRQLGIGQQELATLLSNWAPNEQEDR